MMAWVVGVVVALTGIGAASAHDMAPGVLSLREVAADTYALRVTAPRTPGGAPIPLAPGWPAGCAMAGAHLRCDGPLAGRLTLPALADADAQCLVSIRWLDGRRFDALLAQGATAVEVDAPPGWLRSGIAHILLGPDHVLFVLGLTLLIRRRRALLIAVTGFTVAHSLTLGLAALGIVAPAGAAVELLIAASVLLLAREAACAEPDDPPLTARRPALLVIPFGLLHGLGFAGALGAAADELSVGALAVFNLGVEVGQLAVVAVGVAALHFAPRIRRPAAWAAGAVAGYWTLDRGLVWVERLVG